ncbi:hypothetical protein GCM10010358_27870 [Streptomyces minutiscleroticus]|uniref:Uncharacterized protein n=1 Tax=Streptomyces minutiscleroticus TaxID=68238 RepID=A0A918NI10_9ACTN|nr:hypothetical protein GCM10010358_27870 [Streptomyces minutiscleroticus]
MRKQAYPGSWEALKRICSPKPAVSGRAGAPACAGTGRDISDAAASAVAKVDLRRARRRDGMLRPAPSMGTDLRMDMRLNIRTSHVGRARAQKLLT